MLLSFSLSGKDEMKIFKDYGNLNTKVEVDHFHFRSPMKSHGSDFYSGCSDKYVAVTS